MKLSNLRVAILVLGAAGVLGLAGVYIFRAPLKGFVNGIRAERMQARAVEAFDAEKWSDAARLGTAAHHLDADNPEIDLLVARSLLKLRNAETVAWWKMVLDQPNLPVEELRQLTGSMLGSQQLDEALPFLSRLVELDGDNPETHRLWLESLKIQHRFGKMRMLTGEFAEGGSEDWSIHQAYLYLQKDSVESEAIVDHLKALLNSAGPLALNASRELILIKDLDPETKLLAADYLEEHSEDDLDRLYAASAHLQTDQLEQESIKALLADILADPGEGHLDPLLNWAKRMDHESWFLENVDWETFRANGGAPDAYLGLLLSEKRYSLLLQLTESAATEGGEGMTSFLYYRSLALVETGEVEDAQATLNLAVQTVDPERYTVLERYLARDGHWDLLSTLYISLLENYPDNSALLVKAIGARYYQGNQDELAPLLQRVEMDEFNFKPDMIGFILYTRLLVTGFSPEVHKELETLMEAYPEVFDFRLILGVSYVLQGRSALGEELLAGMPDLGFNAPRYLRVAAVILGLPYDLIALSERDTLLPRERYLISLQND